MTDASPSNPPPDVGLPESSRERAVQKREEAATALEASLRRRTQETEHVEAQLRVVAKTQAQTEVQNNDVREANEHLVVATLAAEQLRDAAEAMRRRQDDFLAMLAHELRNPLAPIRSAANLLERFDTSDPTLTLIRTVIQRQVAHMARLLDDLLDVSRITSGKVQLQRRIIRVSEFVDQAIEMSRPHFDSRHQELILDGPVTPLHVNGDAVRLAQVIANLLHNASKYTQEGGEVSVTVRNQGDMVSICVADNGLGIAAEALPAIFDLFNQEDRSLNHSQGGLGIGLTVARNMMQLHGGTVQARSDGLGKGSEFIVKLPRAIRAPSEGPVAPTPSVVPVAARRILLIDDNADAATMLSILLGFSGHEVTTAMDGVIALEAYPRCQPDVVLCDIGLPGMSGYEIVRQMRQRWPLNLPTFIAVTGYDDPERRARSFAAGFDFHLAKPVDFDSLETAIATARVPSG